MNTPRKIRFEYRRTDLAAELDLSDREGISEQREQKNGFELSDLRIVTDSAAKRLSKQKGRYITIEIGRIWFASDEQFERAADAIADKLSEMAFELLGHRPERLLVVGLGNRRITADALGDEVCGLLTVTRHIKTDRQLFELLGGHELSAFAPGVLGQTGIEASELVAAACERIRPELVIAVDSLCARSTDRLAVTVQLGSSGISPGSGVGNRRKAIDKDLLGIPVIALGVPTVVDSSTLVTDALEKAGITECPHALESVLENGRSFFVTPKDTDMMLRELSRLIADSIDLAFS